MKGVVWHLTHIIHGYIGAKETNTLLGGCWLSKDILMVIKVCLRDTCPWCPRLRDFTSLLIVVYVVVVVLDVVSAPMVFTYDR